MEKSKVYFTETINSEGLVRMYEALGRELKGRVAVKISTGESDKSNNLRPELIEALVKKLNGTIVECGTAYGGNREDVQLHWKEIEKRGRSAKKQSLVKQDRTLRKWHSKAKVTKSPDRLRG